MRRFIKALLLLLLGIAVAGAAAWGALALYYSDIESPHLRLALATAFALVGVATLIALALPRWRTRIGGGFLVVFVALVLWWNTIMPSNDRQWQPEVAVLAHATIDGELVTVHNIRNFDYRTETDFTPAYYDKTFDVRKLQSVDLIAVYWMGPAIAHTILSFGFEGGDHLAVSIETRKEQGEGYSTIKGFFKQFELYYVVADERDVIRVRTNYRKHPPEDVYVYPLRRPMENGRRLFMEYMQRINSLKDVPEFYNTLTTNCTTTIWHNTRVNPGRVPFSWKLLLSGYVPEYLYDVEALDRSVPFPELQRRSLINARAQAADQAGDFSRRIREGLPGAALTTRNPQ
jgi:hypothetical protein